MDAARRRGAATREGSGTTFHVALATDALLSGCLVLACATGTVSPLPHGGGTMALIPSLNDEPLLDAHGGWGGEVCGSKDAANLVGEGPARYRTGAASVEPPRAAVIRNSTGRTSTPRSTCAARTIDVSREGPRP